MGCEVVGKALLYRFEVYELDTSRRELRCCGDLVPLQPQVFDLFFGIFDTKPRARGQQGRLFRYCLGRAHCSDSALTTRINAARSAIGDSGEVAAPDQDFLARAFVLSAAVREEGIRFAAPAGRAATGTPRSRSSRQPFDRRPAVHQHERRSRAGIFRRRHGGGDHYGAVALQLAVRDRAKLVVHLQGQKPMTSVSWARTRCALRARGKRPARRQSPRFAGQLIDASPAPISGRIASRGTPVMSSICRIALPRAWSRPSSRSCSSPRSSG